MDMLQYLPITILIIGILFLIVEIFVPSFGIYGIIGILSTIVGIILVADTIFQGIMILLAIIFALTLILVLYIRFIGKKNKSFILKDTLNEDTKTFEDLAYFIGKKGVAISNLRPSGMAEFDGVRLDVLSQQGYIEKDTPVVASRIEGPKIYVKIDKN